MDESIHSERLEAYTMRAEDLKAYASAVRRIADVMRSENPDVLYCPLRGGYPVLRALDQFIRGCVKDVYMVPTSGFLKEKAPVVRNSFEKILEAYKAPKIAVVDTAITGSSIRHFKRLARQFLSELTRESRQRVELAIIKLWQNRRFDKPCAGSHENGTVIYKDYNFGTGPLFCEDCPDLLGIDYPYQVRTGEKFPFTLPVSCKAPIVVSDGREERRYEPAPSTADTFLKIVKEYIEQAAQ